LTLNTTSCCVPRFPRNWLMIFMVGLVKDSHGVLTKGKLSGRRPNSKSNQLRSRSQIFGQALKRMHEHQQSRFKNPLFSLCVASILKVPVHRYKHMMTKYVDKEFGEAFSCDNIYLGEIKPTSNANRGFVTIKKYMEGEFTKTPETLPTFSSSSNDSSQPSSSKSYASGLEYALIFGPSDPRVQAKLLEHDASLTLNKAIDIARTAKAIVSQLADIRSTEPFSTQINASSSPVSISKHQTHPSTLNDMKLVTLNDSITSQHVLKSAPFNPSQGDMKETLLRDYADCQSGIGCFEGEFHITLDPSSANSNPSTPQGSRALQELLKKELDALEAQGVITKVSEPTDGLTHLCV
ncbi:Hypothetical predicted protein, partial [Paramuricea clavata]